MGQSGAWLCQEYEGEVHVVPTTELGHVLDWHCFCDPTPDPTDPRVVVHRELQGGDDPNVTLRNEELRS
jgi:hypothetical protein